MKLTGIVLIGISLAMDAFAASICKGLAIKKMNLRKNIIISLYFAIFQSVMPILGFLLGNAFKEFVVKIDHWIAFLLLSSIGINMIIEAISKNNEELNDKIDFKSMSILSLATSIDALAVGITLSFFKVNLIFAVSIIGIITFSLTMIGVRIGNKFGKGYERKAELFGGVILNIIGLKILLEHLNII